MKTYVEVLVSSEGGKASEITAIFKELGFDTAFGDHDFVYNWKEKAGMEQVLTFIDHVQGRLKGMGVTLNFSTIR